MNLLVDSFKNYLTSQKKVSPVTLKNYITDLSKFVKWFEATYGKPFQPYDLTPEVINDFSSLNSQLSTQNISPRSLARYISTLRRFTNFLAEQKLISENPFDQLSTLSAHTSTSSDPWHLKAFKNFLYLSGASRLTSKNYMVDIAAFTNWLTETDPSANDSNYIEIHNNSFDEYKQRLTSVLNLSPKTVNRKLSSIRKYLTFAQASGLTKEKKIEQEKKDSSLNLSDLHQAESLISQRSYLNYSSFPPLRLLQKLIVPYLALEDLIANKITSRIHIERLSKKESSLEKLIHQLIYSRPEWYKRYHNVSAVHHLHFAILVAYASIVGLLIYNNLFAQASRTLAATTAPASVLSFQGRLTDKDNNPVASATNVRFIIYSDATASGSALLWQDAQKVAPDTNGIFRVLLGASSNTIPASLFSQQDILYLGITIGTTPELTPRQRIAAVPYATNSETLSGMRPTTDSQASTTNAILALDSSGNLTIGGSAAPTFAAAGGQFKLSGQPLVLATNSSSNSNIQLVPDGTGLIDLQRPLVNTTASGTTSPGGVEVEDRFSVSATESAVAAFIVNNNTTGGDIFAASSSASTRFVLSNTGDISLQPGVAVDTLSIGTMSIGGTNATTLIIGRNGQGIILPGFTGQNGALYGTYGTGDLASAITPTAGLCLISGLQNPSWGPCSSFWSQGPGTITTNIVADVLIGGDSTSSAKFAFINLNAGVPKARIVGNLLVMPGTGGGNVGIGEENPQTRLHVKADSDGDLLRLEDSDGTCNLNPETVGLNIACLSDERLKTNIVDAASVLPLLMQIKVRDYTVRASGEQTTGVIAQELAPIAPQMVRSNSNGLLSVSLPSPWILLKAIQEVNNKIDSIEQVTTQSLSQLSIAREALVSPLASIDEIHTNIISPLAPNQDHVLIKGNLAVDGSATISGSLTANSLQTTADATVAGTLTAQTVDSSRLTVDNATVSGTLYANNIEANSISGLDERIATVSSRTISNYHEQLATASSSDSAALEIGSANWRMEIGNYVDVQNLSADFATFRQGLIAFGPSTFSDASVLNILSIGTNMQIGPYSINTLGGDLEIQSLKQGTISLMAGAVRIETDGTLKVAGTAEFAQDITVHGKVRANVISPLANQDSVNISGNLVASGSGTFDKLKLSLIEPAYAISDTEVVATGSAGTARVMPYRTELTIDNPNVTDKSLIYITPVGTNNQVLNLLRQVPEDPAFPGIEGSFTVGVDTWAQSEKQFNWIIVN